ncbi:kinase-like protein, partial [Stereum hirsutum FP-91666 SS1]|uniref:kinase-like protein n=1 Tax=Stereum hirsutum (strain FP-91666) TaxID=721885 RepID=UPI000440D70B
KYIANPPLRHEACVLLRLDGHPGIPKVYALGRSKFHEYIAIQLLGKTLETFGSVTVVRDLAALTCQMLKIAKHVHSCNLIHGDIKPQNFVFGREEVDQLYLIDYGLATWHTSPRTNDHVESRNLRRLQGTPEYCSIRMHLHKSPSRADDMESLAYTIIHILLGTLPWDSLEIDRDICVLKQLWSGPDLCGSYPALFGEFLDDARNLQFQEQPNYDLWIERF